MEFSKTITSLFLLPSLDFPEEIRELLRTEKRLGYLNAYSWDRGREEYPSPVIFLLFRPLDIALFQEFLEGEQERTGELIDDYDYKGGFVVLVYRLNPHYTNDYQLIREGKYSLTSNKYQSLFKERILRLGTNLENITLQYMIFHRDKNLKKMWEEKIGIELGKHSEVWGAFIRENETLTDEKLEHYVQQAAL